jgi:hypothetical protein
MQRTLERERTLEMQRTRDDLNTKSNRNVLEERWNFRNKDILMEPSKRIQELPS